MKLLVAYEQLAVSDIYKRLGEAEQSLTSHHLATMESKGLLNNSRSGKDAHQALEMREVIDVNQRLAACIFL